MLFFFGEARSSCAHGQWPVLCFRAQGAEPFGGFIGDDVVVNNGVVAELMIGRITPVTKDNHITLRRVAPLADFTRSGIVVPTVWAASSRGCFGGRIELCRAVYSPA